MWGGGGRNGKINLNNIFLFFHEGKGHFASRERALFVSSENVGGGLGPPVPTPLTVTQEELNLLIQNVLVNTCNNDRNNI